MGAEADRLEQSKVNDLHKRTEGIGIRFKQQGSRFWPINTKTGKVMRGIPEEGLSRKDADDYLLEDKPAAMYVGRTRAPRFDKPDQEARRRQRGAI
jgi:hypothetical protein